MVFEEASSFDPSGAYRFTEHGDQSPIDDAAPASKLNQGDVLSDDESIDTLSSDSQLSKSEVLEKDILQLQSLFPRIDGVDIRQVLTNANGVVAAALDSLLNLQYIQSTSDQAPPSNGLLEVHVSGAKSVGKAGDAGYNTSVSNSSRLNSKLITAQRMPDMILTHSSSSSRYIHSKTITHVHRRSFHNVC